MINPSDVATGLLGLGVIAGAVGLVALGGRDRTADQHTVDDYREPAEPDRKQLIRDALVGLSRRHITVVVDVLPPAPAGADAGSPLYVETLFRTWHPEAPEVAAARMLREIAAEQSDDVIWNSRATARDLTGAFPVVAVA